MAAQTLFFRRQISSPHSNGMTFKFKVKYKWGRQICGFQHKTVRISETVSDTAKVLLLYRLLTATHHELLIGATFDDLE